MTSEHGSRPRPRYGEYADPNSETQAQVTEEPSATLPAPPERTRDQAPSYGVVVQDSARDDGQPQSGADSIQGAAGQSLAAQAQTAASGEHLTPQVAPQRANIAGPIPGVPHNLGAKGSNGQGVQPAPQNAQAQSDPANQSALNAPHAPMLASKNATAGSAGAGATQARPRSADRIVTIILLSVGAYFALSMALTLSQFALEFSRVADELGVKDFAAPPMLTTLGTIGAILVLAIYALVLIFSIRRLRARKVTFWAPLVAGVLAWVLFFVLFFVGLNQSTELWQALLSIASDPAAAQQMIERLNSKS